MILSTTNITGRGHVSLILSIDLEHDDIHFEVVNAPNGAYETYTFGDIKSAHEVYKAYRAALEVKGVSHE